MKIWLMIVLLLVTGQVWGQEGTTLEVCEAWSQHIHNDEEQAAYDQVCADVDTAPLAQPPAETTVASDDLATTEEAEMWVQLFDSGNQFAPTAAGLWLDEDFLGDVEILVGGVTCDIYDEYLLAGEWAIIPLCSSSNDPGYLDAPDTLRVEMREDWDSPTFYYRCVESVVRQEEWQRTYACELLAPPPSVIPTEIWVQLFDSGNQFAPTAAGLWLDEDFLGDVEILIGGVTCDIYDEYLLAGEWAIIPLCSSSNDPGYLDAPDTLRVEMQEDWGEPTSYFRCVEDADSQEEERRMYACEFLRSR